MHKPIENFHVVSAMNRYGGSFAKALSEAFFTADADNFARLKAAFPELWAEYEEMARFMLEKEKK